MKIATHNGMFHGDDVFAIAALKACGMCDEVVRTRDAKEMAACDLRVDVGLQNNPQTGDFDHHQPAGAGKRPNGIKYASFGLIWQTYGAKLCGSEEAASLVDQKLVQVVDGQDNGQNLFEPTIEGLTIATVDRAIALFNPTWDQNATEEDTLAAFHEAVGVAQKLLEREVAIAVGQVKAAKIVRKAISKAEDSRLIILDQFMSWRQVVVSEAPHAQFVIFPRQEGTWALQAVPKTIGSFDRRVDLPAAWAGKQADELTQISGVADAVFCHSGRFLAIARSKEGILALAQLALL